MTGLSYGSINAMADILVCCLSNPKLDNPYMDTVKSCFEKVDIAGNKDGTDEKTETRGSMISECIKLIQKKKSPDKIFKSLQEIWKKVVENREAQLGRTK